MTSTQLNACKQALEMTVAAASPATIVSEVQRVMHTALNGLDANDRAALKDWAQSELTKLDAPLQPLAVHVVDLNNRRRAMLLEVLDILSKAST
jgi:hypothetical protein